MIKKPSKSTADAESRYVSEGDPNTEEKIQKARTKKLNRKNISGREKGKSRWMREDQQLAVNIRAAIQKEPAIPSSHKNNIDVVVANGIATLTGTVSSSQEKLTIGDKAVAWVGLGHVNNQLVVLGEEDGTLDPELKEYEREEEQRDIL